MNIREALSYDDVLLIPKHGVLEKRIDADISSELVEGFILPVPIISANMPSVTDGKMAKEMHVAGGLGVIHRFNSIEDQMRECLKCWPHPFACAIGLKDGHERAFRLMETGCQFFVLDTAHADHEQVINFIEKTHPRAIETYLIVGNIATYEAAERLANAGVDAIKVGIGPGAACTTRETTGFGIPQLTAVNDVSKVKEVYPHIRIIADGGIKNSGDIVKALAAGADTVMIGSLLAGADEAPEPGVYYGNASKRMNGHHAPEGIEGTVLRSGSVSDIIKKLAWGIRSGISYGGATNIQELRENAEWVRCTPQAMLESGTRIG